MTNKKPPSEKPNQLKACASGDSCLSINGPNLPITLEFWYFTEHGNPRKHCKECDKAIRRRDHSKNRERDNKRSLDYIARNKKAVSQYQREYYEENRETILDQIKARRRTDIQFRANDIKNQHNRRAQYYNVEGVLTVEDFVIKYEAQEGRCWYCQIELGNEWHTDHRVPMSRGGKNTPENVVLCCAQCNQKKHHKLPHEWDGRLL